jgi:hypothetical protein
VKKFLMVLAVCNIVLLSLFVPSQSEEKPVNLSLFTPVQIINEEHDITIFRFNLIYGRNASVRGVDLGLVNHTTTGACKAWQIGIVGWADTDFLGWQYSTLNVTKGNFKGLQWGAVNYAGHMNGLQLGFFNYAETAHGLQIGFINVIREGGFLPVFPIVNWSF